MLKMLVRHLVNIQPKPDAAATQTQPVNARPIYGFCVVSIRSWSHGSPPAAFART